MKLSIIIPARNEELIIKKTIDDISDFLKDKKYKYEIIIIINGSRDKTLEIVKKISQENKFVKFYKSRVGYGYALVKGMRISKGKIIAIFNADFYDLNMLNLVDADMCNKDMYIGSKMTYWSADRRPFVRRLTSIVFNKFLNLFFGFRGSDTHGIKLIKRKVIKKILPLCKTRSGIFDTEFVILSQRYGLSIADFPVFIAEVRPSRFSNRLIQTFRDIKELYMSLKKVPKNEKYYDEISSDWEYFINNEETDRRIYEIFSQTLPLKGKKVLEVGCGLGSFVGELIDRNANVTAIDISSNLIKRIKKIYPRQKFYVRSAYDTKFKNNSFDFVLCTEVIEHISKNRQKKAVSEIIRLVKPGGYFLITTPNKLWYPLFYTLNKIGVRPYNGIENWLSKNELLRLIHLDTGSVKIIKKLSFNLIPPLSRRIYTLDRILNKILPFGVNHGLLCIKE